MKKSSMMAPMTIMASVAAVLVLSSASMASAADAAGLDMNFYGSTCPRVEAIVKEEMVAILKAAPTLAGPLLRLHFHDCFVRGCDASVLLDSTPTSTAEKDATPNLTLRGFGSVQRVKDRLEQACPGTVSCADVLALMARDAVVLANGPSWPVALGRRDGRVSLANETNQLPPPTANFTRLVSMFAAKGLSVRDLVVLSGGHTLGTAHCNLFSDRLYNFTGANSLADVDPALDAAYLARLRSRCRSLADNTTLNEMDPGSFLSFDSSYYSLVARRRGLFHSDAALLTDPATRAYVQRQATGLFTAEFFRDFADSMVKMSTIDVLTGQQQGEIRKKCNLVN
uniref:Peroxidase n=1 Tax=Zea mays TaxID=4577 RepID=B6STZ5_MAIZE|nr:peroxidase 1 precursor [Zea mays]ACN30929.1 unknown [Zea mays]|eukprot:NP_001147671.1 peroxidase 1 precursor [Zea mays]